MNSFNYINDIYYFFFFRLKTKKLIYGEIRRKMEKKDNREKKK